MTGFFHSGGRKKGLGDALKIGMNEFILLIAALFVVGLLIMLSSGFGSSLQEIFKSILTGAPS